MDGDCYECAVEYSCYSTHTEVQYKGVVYHAGSQSKADRAAASHFYLLWFISCARFVCYEFPLQETVIRKSIWSPSMSSFQCRYFRWRVMWMCILMRSSWLLFEPVVVGARAFFSLSCSQGREKGALNRFLRIQLHPDWQEYHFSIKKWRSAQFFFSSSDNIISYTLTPALVLQHLNVQTSLLPT